MIALIWAVVPGPLKLVLGGLLIIVGLAAYDYLIDDPQVRREARRDFVHISERAALEARLELEKKTNAALIRMNEEYEKELLELQQIRAREDEQLEQEIADYEQKLEAAGRSCRLDSDDIDWLSKP